MGKGKKGKGKDGPGQNNDEQDKLANGGPSASKKGSIWKLPPKVFIPAIPNETDTWKWPALPSATTDAQQSQKSQAGGSSAKTASVSTKKITSISDPSSSTFGLRYYTNNSVPPNGSLWVHPPAPSKNGSIKSDDSELEPDLRSWAMVPENAKWSSLPSWVVKQPYINDTTLRPTPIPWCTKKRPIALVTPPKSWTAVSKTDIFPTPPEQENPNSIIASSGIWGVPEPVIAKDPNAANPWANMTDEEISMGPKEKFPTLVNWPFTGEEDRFNKLASLGLFVENYKVNVFKHPKDNQNQSALIRVLQVEGVNDILLKMIWEHHSTASALSRASQKSWDVLMAVTDIWDVTGGNYGGCEVPRKDNMFSVGIPPVVVVTPTRDGEPIKYVDQVINLHKMCRAMYNFGKYMQNIQFHHVPFLTTHILALVIPEMTKLRVLGVYNCQLIPLTEGQELLHIIQRDRPHGCENQVSLDFYPTYHVGPCSTYQVGDKKGEKKLGEFHSYGVSWDDTGLFVDADTRIAIWQEVGSLVYQARSQGIDFESKHTMFRQWLDKSPCLAVEETLKVILNPHSRVENVIAHVAYGEFGGRVEKFKKSVPGKVPNKPEGSQWMKDGFRCRVCNIVHLGLYFSYNMIRLFKLDDQDRPMCMGCKLADYLAMERDHYKHEKRVIIKRWLWDLSLINEDPTITGDWNTQNLPKFLRIFRRTQGRHVLQMAQMLDIIRKNNEQKAQPEFHETDEVQRPINYQALGRRGHYELRAPTVQEKKAIEGGKIHKEWDCFRRDRINGHGQPTTFRGW
ncbi:hypothetical protein NHQ30_002921 [Ciborinia camelliae]|nr:hypothetical protein NHQ30_002921 [Ciborinia camelliae]